MNDFPLTTAETFGWIFLIGGSFILLLALVLQGILSWRSYKEVRVTHDLYELMRTENVLLQTAPGFTKAAIASDRSDQHVAAGKVS